jgi:hypothetical protein
MSKQELKPSEAEKENSGLGREHIAIFNSFEAMHAASKIANQGEEEKPEVKQEPVGYLLTYSYDDGDGDFYTQDHYMTPAAYERYGWVPPNATITPLYTAPIEGEEEKLRADNDRLRAVLKEVCSGFETFYNVVDKFHDEYHKGETSSHPDCSICTPFHEAGKSLATALKTTPTEDETA